MLIEKKTVATINQEKVSKITFKNDNNYSASFFNFGGYIHSITIPYKKNLYEKEDILLGYENFNQYTKDQSYLNCIVGRVCNRISNSNFFLNNKKYNLFSNAGFHHLHGGKEGFNKKIWKIKSLDQTSNRISCVLEYTSPHLEEGYPGELECKVTYSLTNKNEFIIDFVAETHHDTIINLTNHNYWNFHGHKNRYQNILNHFVKINAKLYCESDEDLIPTGRLLNVKKTKFDFFLGKMIDKTILENQAIDTCFCIDNFDKKIKVVGSVYSDLTKMGAIFYSDQPGLQFYTGNMMSDRYSGKYSRSYGKQFGLCFEPQLFPDAINHSNFISPILHKGEKYNSRIIMELRNDF